LHFSGTDFLFYMYNCFPWRRKNQLESLKLKH
jgi:hypothetical protein